ncbi:hypothetical protein NPIL_296291 [Nephila pilipes]|uniref:Uncharacterized protein n=1 Tax=Nephila pilipes TaxID=299642 RepID=A0A8X6U688_NEPPI|nr:hypothetical protein NPIL_296291 [Nephila pilipes]
MSSPLFTFHDDDCRYEAYGVYIPCDEYAEKLAFLFYGNTFGRCRRDCLVESEALVWLGKGDGSIGLGAEDWFLVGVGGIR